MFETTTQINILMFIMYMCRYTEYPTLPSIYILGCPWYLVTGL